MNSNQTNLAKQNALGCWCRFLALAAIITTLTAIVVLLIVVGSNEKKTEVGEKLAIFLKTYTDSTIEPCKDFWRYVCPYARNQKPQNYEQSYSTNQNDQIKQLKAIDIAADDMEFSVIVSDLQQQAKHLLTDVRLLEASTALRQTFHRIWQTPQLQHQQPGWMQPFLHLVTLCSQADFAHHLQPSNQKHPLPQLHNRFPSIDRFLGELYLQQALQFPFRFTCHNQLYCDVAINFALPISYLQFKAAQRIRERVSVELMKIFGIPEEIWQFEQRMFTATLAANTINTSGNGQALADVPGFWSWQKFMEPLKKQSKTLESQTVKFKFQSPGQATILAMLQAVIGRRWKIEASGVEISGEEYLLRYLQARIDKQVDNWLPERASEDRRKTELDCSGIVVKRIPYVWNYISRTLPGMKQGKSNVKPYAQLIQSEFPELISNWKGITFDEKIASEIKSVQIEIGSPALSNFPKLFGSSDPTRILEKIKFKQCTPSYLNQTLTWMLSIFGDYRANQENERRGRPTCEYLAAITSYLQWESIVLLEPPNARAHIIAKNLGGGPLLWTSKRLSNSKKEENTQTNFEHTVVLTDIYIHPYKHSKQLPYAIDFGQIGWVIAHELMHVWQRILYSIAVNTTNKNTVGANFKKGKSCLIDSYGQLPISKLEQNLMVDGQQTFVENFSDILGIQLSWQAYANSTYYQHDLQYLRAAKMEISPAQLFFIGIASTMTVCKNINKAMLDKMTLYLQLADKHTFGANRIRGLISNTPQFQNAFNCKPVRPYRKFCLANFMTESQIVYP